MLHVSKVNCNGNERDIKDCRHLTFDDCSSYEGLGVRCYGAATFGEGTSVVYGSSIDAHVIN